MGKLIITVGNIVDDGLLANADAVVCPTNPMMKLGSGACGAIFRKAGVKELENYTEKAFGVSYDEQGRKNAMRPTEIRITPGFQIPCDIIFAQGGKVWECPTYDEALSLLVTTYKNLLNCITQRGYERVVLPALGTGHYGFTHEGTAKIVKELLTAYVLERNVTLILVLIDEESAKWYK